MYFKKAVELDPYDARSYTSLGIMYYFKGEESTNPEKRKFNEMAIQAHEKAIQINPNYAKAYSNLGISLYIVGQISHDQPKIRHAISAEQKAIAIDSNFAKAYANLASIYSLEGQKNEALEWLAQAIEHGYTALGEMRNDPTLNNIRNTERYKELEAKLAAKLGET
jgi:tetratricopeptide (TPR) repeat protein